MRTVVLTALLLVAPSLGAFESSLVLRPPAGSQSELVVTINPTLGTVQLYRVEGERLVRQSSSNFLADLDYLLTAPAPGKFDWPLLRVGSPTSLPTYAQMLDQWFPQASQPGAAVPLSQRVLNTEEEYWKETPEYDGVVRAAVGPESLVVVVPSTYTILFYWIRNWELRLAGWRNYRTDLYIPQVYQSQPTPQALLQALPQDVQQARRDQLQQQMEALGDAAGQTIPIAPSDPWVGNAIISGAELFVVVDPPNQRILSYQFRGIGGGARLELTSARNMEIDLLIPTTYGSQPLLTNIIAQYNEYLQRKRLPPVSEAYLRKLLGARTGARAGKQTSEMYPHLESQTALLFLNFAKRNKIFMYRLTNGTTIELLSARDYTLEAGIAMHARELTLRERAVELADRMAKEVNRDTPPDQAFAMMEQALDWNPWLYQEIERNNRLRRILGQDPRWQQLIEQATQAVQEAEELQKQIMEEIKQEQQAKQQR